MILYTHHQCGGLRRSPQGPTSAVWACFPHLQYFTLRVEMGVIECQEEDVPKGILWYTPMGFLGVIRPHHRDEAWSASLCQSFFATCVGENMKVMEEMTSLNHTHTHHTRKPLSSINLVSILRCSSPPHNLVYGRRVAPSVFAFSLSSHRHFYMFSV